MIRHTLHHADNLAVLRSMPDNSVDSIVTDPPYGLSFMGKRWDYDVPSSELWAECLRVLKPGGHLLAFAGTRTQHRMAVRIEDAGFEIRDMIAWVYGSGFPKSLDVSKAIDKAAGAERTSRVNERWQERYPNGPGGNLSGDGRSEHYGQAKRIIGNPLMTSDPSTEAAKQWDGWGTALKPAMEPITVARKPFDVTVAENVLTHGTGALNIDGCRVATSDVVTNHARSDASAVSKGIYGDSAGQETHQTNGQKLGRWPANLIHDGSEEVVAGFPADRPGAVSNGRKGVQGTCYGERGPVPQTVGRGDSGSAARFFYCAKASRADRDDGLDGTHTMKYTPLVGGKPCKDVSTVLVGLLQKATSGSTLRWHIGESGESITGLCPSDSLSTIATRINKITESKILSLLTHSLISDCIAGVRSATASGGSPAANAAKSSALQTATTPERLEALALGARDAASKMLCEISDAANWKPRSNVHATVKPTDLMRYLCRLVTPPGGVVLDPFMGSGSTGKAAMLEGFGFIGIEREADYVAIAERRIAVVSTLQPEPEEDKQQRLFGGSK